MSVGGTGKTPTILLLLSLLSGRVAYISRGYRRKERKPYVGCNPTPEQVGDEAMLVSKRFPEVTLSIDDHKWQAVQAVDGTVDVMIVDDGLQRHDIPMDIRIATIDCQLPDGYGYLLPRGLLREPFSWVKNVDYLVLTNAYTLPHALIERFKDKPLIITRPVISSFITPAENEMVLEPGQKVALFSSIAHPERFSESMKSKGYEVVDHLIAGDHVEIKDEKLIEYAEKVHDKHPGIFLVGTEKDWVKKKIWPQIPLLFARMNVMIVQGHQVMHALVDTILGNEK